MAETVLASKLVSGLRKLFNLYPGEAKAASCFLLLGFLWSLGAFGGLTLSEGMFLEHVGAAHLPKSYIITASLLCLLSAILLLALQRLSISYLFCAILFGAVASDLLLYFLLSTESVYGAPWVWYLFKAIGWMIPIVVYISFWAFLDQYYDLQDAKRCFCLFNSVLYLGDAFAGGLISFTLEYIGIQGLLLLFITAMLSSIPLILYITKRKKPVPEESSDGNPQRTSSSLKQIFNSITRSPFTLTLMLFYFIMQLIVITTEYSYMDTFEKAFSHTPKGHSLTAFLGTLAMLVSLGNMFFGLFFYSRTVTKWGVNNVILIAPLFFVGLFAAWMCSSKEGLLLATLAFVAREGMIYTFDDNNLLLLISGVPTRVKNQVRIAIETFFEPIGMLIGASLLLFLNQMSLTLGGVLSLCALVCVLLLRTQYPKAIFSNLIAHAIDFEKKVVDWICGFSKREFVKVQNHLLTYLKKSDEPTKLLAFEYLVKMKNPELLQRLLNYFGRFSIKGKLRMIEILAESAWANETQVIECFEKWRKTTPHPSIRSQIHFYLAEHRSMRKEIVMQNLLSDHLGLKGSAILSLKTSSETLSQTLTALENLKRLLDSSDEDEICIGLEILGYEKRKENIRDLFPYLQNPSPRVAQAAAKSIAMCMSMCADKEFTEYNDKLIAHLALTSDPSVRHNLLKALGNSLTADCVSSLIKASIHFRLSERKSVENSVAALADLAPLEEIVALMHDQLVHVRCRLLAGKIVGKIAQNHLKAHLHALLDAELSQAYFYLYHAEKIRKDAHAEELAILEDALQTTYRSHLDFIVQLIAIATPLATPLEECEVLCSTLHSKNRKIRAHALESLEKMSDPTLFALIWPLLDERRPAERLRLYVQRGVTPLTLNELLDVLEYSPSMANRIVSLTIKTRLQLPGWKDSLRMHQTKEKPLFSHFAAELLEAHSL